MTDSQKFDKEAQSAGCCNPQVEIFRLAGRPPAPIPEPIPSVPWISGVIETPVGKIPVVRTKLQLADILGSWKARWGIRRMSYRIQPRLYAVGNPTDASPVFVTANFKMSFDRLRSQLDGIDGWILVLDTKGINVWCAAGKGTFGTAELLNRIEVVGLKKIVSHRRLIVPQLGATGVSAHLIREGSGFHVFYGPVRARDLRAFMQAGMKATSEMRQVTFTLSERIVLVPADIVGNLKYAVFIAACLLLLSGVGVDLYSMDRVAHFGIANAVFVLIAALCGAVFPASLLPWLPGRAFSVKGALAGIIPMVGMVLLRWLHPEIFRSWLSFTSWILFFPAVSSFIGMNFTGSSTYTSLSGVKKEMRIALPVQIGAAVCGLVLWITGLFV